MHYTDKVITMQLGRARVDRTVGKASQRQNSPTSGSPNIEAMMNVLERRGAVWKAEALEDLKPLKAKTPKAR